jgi:hypothetical protein
MKTRFLLLLAALATLLCGSAVAADFTVVNNCSYTIYPGIYPATYANGGWEMAPKTQVTPTFIIGTLDAQGKVMSVKKTVVGASPFEAFKAALDPLLAAR